MQQLTRLFGTESIALYMYQNITRYDVGINIAVLLHLKKRGQLMTHEKVMFFFSPKKMSLFILVTFE